MSQAKGRHVMDGAQLCLQQPALQSDLPSDCAACQVCLSSACDEAQQMNENNSLTCVGTVMASLMRGSACAQSAAAPAACSGSASRKPCTSGCAAASVRSSPVRFTNAPRRCSSAPRIASRSA
jgi:hypothetical protein